MFKKMLSVGPQDQKTGIALLLLRVGITVLMMFHGVPKLIKLFSGEEIQFADPLGIGASFTFVLAVFAEFFCSLFVLVGLGTRFAVIPLIFTMLSAVFFVHFEQGFKGMETPLLYLMTYVVLLIAGSGKYSFDNRLLKN